MYRVWVEEILGLKIRRGQLRVDPVIPSWWHGFRLYYRHGESIYEIRVENPDGVNHGVAWTEIDGRRLPDHVVTLEEAPIKHRVQVRMGKVGNASVPGQSGST
jgi:cyclic beta-1,2-glucan synthetase